MLCPSQGNTTWQTIASHTRQRFLKNAHAGSRTRVTSMGDLYGAATLHAPLLGTPRSGAAASEVKTRGLRIRPATLFAHAADGACGHSKTPGHKRDDPPRTRTCNLRLRRLTPYPLGQRAGIRETKTVQAKALVGPSRNALSIPLNLRALPTLPTARKYFTTTSSQRQHLEAYLSSIPRGCKAHNRTHIGCLV